MIGNPIRFVVRLPTNFGMSISAWLTDLSGIKAHDFIGFQEPSHAFRRLPGNPFIVTFVVSGFPPSADFDFTTSVS